LIRLEQIENWLFAGNTAFISPDVDDTLVTKEQHGLEADESN
jgi:hypothetical protein